LKTTASRIPGEISKRYIPNFSEPKSISGTKNRFYIDFEKLGRQDTEGRKKQEDKQMMLDTKSEQK
jgi:hypothetical protein